MVASSKMIMVGPWGGRGGSPWDDGASGTSPSHTGASWSRCDADRAGLPVRVRDGRERSLTFATSRGKVHRGRGRRRRRGAVRLPDVDPVVVGFTGRSGCHLDALGLYVGGAAARDALRRRPAGARARGVPLLRLRRRWRGAETSASSEHRKKKPFEWCYK